MTRRLRREWDAVLYQLAMHGTVGAGGEDAIGHCLGLTARHGINGRREELRHAVERGGD